MLRTFLSLAIAFTACGFVSARDVDAALKEKALALNSVTKKDALDKKLKELIRDKSGTKKLLAAALEMQKEGAGKSPFKLNATILLARSALAVKEYSTAETFFEYTVSQAEKVKDEERLVDSYFGMIQLYFLTKDYGKVETWFMKYNDLGDTRAIQEYQFQVLRIYILSLAKQGETDKALEKVEALTQSEGFGWIFLDIKALVQYEAGKIDDAIKTTKEQIEKIEDLDRLPAEARTEYKREAQYKLSGYLVDANKVEEATKLLKKLIEEDPENPTCYNDLGFIWADHDMNLEESEKLIRKALELDTKRREKELKKKEIDETEAKTQSAAYLDSLGWVLYKSKKYAEAKKYLLEATKDEEDGNHIEIWDHLADVHMAMGETKQAIDVWVKALKLDDNTKKDTERRKKVTEKLKKAKDMINKK
ncbi:MAG: tetratricopeptide repeat protein [Gemmataceae bacterium]